MVIINEITLFVCLGRRDEEKAQAFIANNDGFVKKQGRDIGIQSGSKKLNETER